MKTVKNKNICIDFGIGMIIGFINGIFGSGGGMIAVPVLTKKGFEQKEAHRNALAVLLPVSMVSAGLYISKKIITVLDVFPYLIPGIIGVIIGTVLMSKISPKLLKGVFGGFMIYAGVRLLLR